MHRLLLLLPLSLVLAACGGDGGHDAHGDDSPVAEGARTVEVAASSFAFDPPQIRAAAGEDLAIRLRSVDIEHDFTIDDLDAHVAAGAGETATGGFNTGAAPATYTYYCSVPGHREAGMEGELVVE